MKKGQANKSRVVGYCAFQILCSETYWKMCNCFNFKYWCLSNSIKFEPFKLIDLHTTKSLNTKITDRNTYI